MDTDKDFALEPAGLRLMAREELLDCNALTGRFGLSLSDRQIDALIENRFDALRATGRVEFGGGILKKLIYAFCDSPYISQENYEETLAELQDSFYYYKNESEDRISDDDLIGYMKTVFDGVAQGSLEYLSCTSLEALCRKARLGCDGSGSDPDDQLF